MSKKPSSTDTMLAQLIIKTYCPDTIQDVHEIVHTLFVSILEQMEENEIDRFIAGSPGNYKNGHTTRILRSIYGELHLSLPRDRFSCYESRLFPKHIRTLPEITHTVKRLNQLGFSHRNISLILAELYHCHLSYQAISDILRSSSSV